MFNKTVIKKSIIICLIILILIGFFIKIRRTLARYRTDVTNDGNISVAFMIIQSDYTETQRLIFSELIPSDEFQEYTCTVSNNNSSIRTETNIEYEINIKTTTYLPLEYKFYKKYIQDGVIIWKQCVAVESVSADTDGTYYKNIVIQEANSESTWDEPININNDDGNLEYQEMDLNGENEGEKFKLPYTEDITDEIKIKVRLPSVYKTQELYQDLIEYFEITLSAQQEI
jgi:hypothetical protein